MATHADAKSGAPAVYACSVILVSWNVRAQLADCLASLERQSDRDVLEIIVVDNASADGTVEMVRERFANVRCIANSENDGFARANNRGIEVASGRHILLLNPDTIVPEGAVAGLLAYLERSPDIGIVGPRLLNADGSLQPSVRGLPTFASSACIVLKLQHFFPKLPSLAALMAIDHNYDQDADVKQVMGACFLIRRELLDAIGMLDDGFWIWLEEVDYCRRALDAGWKVRYASTVSVTHLGGASFAQVSGVRSQWRFLRSLNRYFRKHGTLFERIGLWVLEPLGLLLVLILSPFRT